MNEKGQQQSWLTPPLVVLALILALAAGAAYARLGYRSLSAAELAARAEPPLQWLLRRGVLRARPKSEAVGRLPDASYTVGAIAVVCRVVTALGPATPWAGVYAAALLAAADDQWAEARTMEGFAGETLAVGLLILAMLTLARGAVDRRRALGALALAALAIGLGRTAGILAVPTILLALVWRRGEDAAPDGKQWPVLVAAGVAVLACLAYFGWYRQVPAEHRDYVRSLQQAAGSLPPVGAGVAARLGWTLRGAWSFLLGVYPSATASAKAMWLVAAAATLWGLVRWPRGRNLYRVWVGLAVLLCAALGFLGWRPWGAVRELRCLQLAFIPFAAHGLALAWRRQRRLRLVLRAVFGLLATWAIGSHLYSAAEHPELYEHSRPLIRHLQAHAPAGDNVIVHPLAKPAFQYYWRPAKAVTLEKMPYPRGQDKVWERFLTMLPKRERATWLLFSNPGGKDDNEGMATEQLLRRHNIPFGALRERGARLLRVAGRGEPAQ